MNIDIQVMPAFLVVLYSINRVKKGNRDTLQFQMASK